MMVRFAAMALGALALGTSSCAVSAQEIRWTIKPGERPGQIQLQFERSRPGHDNTNSFETVPARLQGLNLDIDGPTHFTLRPEAGLLDCDGTMRSRRGTGTCRFTADTGFAEMLAKYGMARPDDDERYGLTTLDAHIATVDALMRFGFPRPTLGQFMALTVHGANEGWLQGLASAGQSRITIDDLIAYRVHGVTGGWLHGLISADPALANARGGDVIAMRIHGVTPKWVQGLADAGYRNIAADDLVSMWIQDVTPEFARAAAEMGGRPSPKELISRRIMGQR